MTEALRTIENFCKRTGFKINYNKTTIYRIGSLRCSKAQLYTVEKVDWTNSPINILGVKVSQETDRLQEINYKDIICKAQGILLK